MKILLVNKFFYEKGGSEKVFFDTAQLLRSKGNKVMFFSMKDSKNLESYYNKYFVSSAEFENSGSFDRALKSSLRIMYSFESRKKIRQLLKTERPDVIHLHNIYHQISPSILHEIRNFKIPVIMTLHDYKLVCPVYTLFHNDKICESCKNKKFYYCFLKKCCKDSFLKSFLSTAEMYLHHNLLRIYRYIDLFVSPSVFLKNKISEMGFKKRIIYLPNFIKTEEYKPDYNELNSKNVIYIGRLSEEKGIMTLLDSLKGVDVSCNIYGEGPFRGSLEKKIKNEHITNVHLRGFIQKDAIIKEIKNSMFVIIPSEWYENNPVSILESFALGKPVIGSQIGGIPELVIDGKTGLIFKSGDSADLKDKIKYLLNNTDKIRTLGRNARKFVEKEFNPDNHYKNLMNIYNEAIKNTNARES